MELAVWRSWWRHSGESELRQVVLDSWDPIGVSDIPEAADEYDTYLGRIGARLRDGLGTEELARFLTDLTSHMGVDPRPEADMRAAHEIESWYVSSTAGLRDARKETDTSTIASFSVEQVRSFERDGFLIVEEGLVSERALGLLRQRYEPLFYGEYETGIRPDEVNWVPGRDPEDRTRQLCNAWKSDTVIAAQVLSERTGRLAAQLAGYRGVRILQDNVLWKPPGTKAIGFHQDSSYADYLVPPEMITCWVSLHETQADAGPIEFVRGSHTWPKSPPTRSEFHAPDDWLAGPRAAAPEGMELDLVPVVVKPGGGSFHHGLTWHGSAPNRSGTVARMALVSHFLPVEARFHETNVDVNYSRYRRRGDLSMDESFFPVVWTESGYRTPWLAGLPDLDG